MPVAQSSFSSFAARAQRTLLGCGATLLLALSTPALAANTANLDELAAYAGIDKSLLDNAITQANYQQKIIDTMTRPYESKPWYTYRKLFITQDRINSGVQFYLQNEQTLQAAQQQLGVAPEIICAIIGVETFYGRNMGSWKVLDALYTLGFHYPARASYFSKEFANYVKLATREGWNLTDIKGSYAGAMGMGQFMPSSYLSYAIDFDGDNHVNLFNDVQDAIGSVANYFRAHGWVDGGGVMYPAHVYGNDGKVISRATIDALMDKEWKLTPQELYAAGITTKVNLSPKQNIRLYSYELEDGTYDYQVGLNNFNAITRYNKSPLYARAVFELSEAIAVGYQEAKLLQGQYVGPAGKRP
ncbi:MAG: lytic murein transglycosylase B [Candidatus Anaerobiospirillum pullicola]|uniref:Lytic murein transglycosylase B n=1 Tax=Candidatus Anaerobiospirillum pullicola TaxID=2838451 RepID=A0A948TGM6_9GAMM|nr:lytic murein transglycosylase B [Candidatus Anaerobiospirillum pullicola]